MIYYIIKRMYKDETYFLSSENNNNFGFSRKINETLSFGDPFDAEVMRRKINTEETDYNCILLRVTLSFKEIEFKVNNVTMINTQRN